MGKEYSICIDEAGDLGYKKGTKWFVISACIVETDNEKDIRKKLDNIKSKLNVNQVHLRNIKDYPKRSYITNEIKDLPFTYINILVDTDNRDPKLSPNTAYNYACRLLVERITWFLKDNDGQGKIVLSSRGTSRDNELIEYIKSLLKYSYNEVKNNISKVEAKPFGSWDLLQLADVCATTTFLAFEVARYGLKYPCFMFKIKDHLYKHGETTKSYGQKFLSSDMEISSDEFKIGMPCK